MTKEPREITSLGHGHRLPLLFDRALAALLTSTSYAEAANKAGCTVETLRDWMKNSEFAEAYAERRAEVLDLVVKDLQQAVRPALECLIRNLTCGNAQVEASVARTLLENGLNMPAASGANGRTTGERMEIRVVFEQHEPAYLRQPAIDIQQVGPDGED